MQERTYRHTKPIQEMSQSNLKVKTFKAKFVYRESSYTKYDTSCSVLFAWIIGELILFYAYYHCCVFCTMSYNLYCMVQSKSRRDHVIIVLLSLIFQNGSQPSKLLPSNSVRITILRSCCMRILNVVVLKHLDHVFRYLNYGLIQMHFRGDENERTNSQKYRNN